MIADLVKKGRSIRRYFDTEVNKEDIYDAIMNSRLSPSTFNIQSLRYRIVTKREERLKISSHIVWGGLEPKQYDISKYNPPGAFLLIFNDQSIIKSTAVGCNLGIAAQTINLSLVEKGYGTCMLQSFPSSDFIKFLNLEQKYDLLMIMAIGHPNEQVKIKDIEIGESTKYYTENRIHYVPKITLDSLII